MSETCPAHGVELPCGIVGCPHGVLITPPIPAAQAIADAAVVIHLVRLIQDSPDVRYYVGGWGSQMRDLLVAALRVRGADNPVALLQPAPHHADDEPRIKRLECQLDELRQAARAHLEGGKSVADACDARDRLQELL